MSIASKLQDLAELRDDLITNLQAQGVDTTGLTTFTQLVPKVNDIESVATVLTGSCGANVTYDLKSDGTMYLTGTGACNNYNQYTMPFKNAEKLVKKVVVEPGVTTIGESMFQGCTWLEEVTMTSSVTTIGAGAFSGCTALESITLASGLTTIGNSAFYNCSGLTSVTFPNTLLTIGSSCFSGSGLTTAVVIPDSVTSVGGQAFDWNTHLLGITFGSGLTSIGWYVLRNCTALTEINIPSSVTTIDANAFNSCTQQGLVIDIDKEQDSISGSPWGATNATINWNG